MLVCGNAIAEIGGKKIVAIVAMPLPKIWEEKKNSGCRNHMWGIKKKKSAISTIFLQYFHKKSQEINYY